MNYNLLDDHELVDGILNNDNGIIEYFFNKKCSRLFSYILFSVFDGEIDKRELVSELFIFMHNNNWQVLRRFQYRSSLMTYVTVVAVRFFQKKRVQMIDSAFSMELSERNWKGLFAADAYMDQKMDIQVALGKMPNDRYRKVIEDLDIRDMQPEQLANEMNITVDNLYNIHRRALLQLRVVMGNKEEYV